MYSYKRAYINHIYIISHLHRLYYGHVKDALSVLPVNNGVYVCICVYMYIYVCIMMVSLPPLCSHRRYDTNCYTNEQTISIQAIYLSPYTLSSLFMCLQGGEHLPSDSLSRWSRACIPLSPPSDPLYHHNVLCVSRAGRISL